MDISVVIITRNEAHIIANTLQSLEGCTNDIVVVDSGSTDGTVQICKHFKASVIITDWAGYGINKNKGIAAAKNDWILSLDADEAIDPVLKRSLIQLSSPGDNEVFNIPFKNFYCNKWIRFGEWGSGLKLRLFNRRKVEWNDADVHEDLILPAGTKITILKGNILHYTVQNPEEYTSKMNDYALMNAKKYFKKGKRSNFFKQWLSPVFNFLQNYIFRLGFLDGKEGFIIAKTNARYTFLKYNYLKEMNRNPNH